MKLRMPKIIDVKILRKNTATLNNTPRMANKTLKVDPKVLKNVSMI